jgi:transposase, IS30 family
VRIVNKLTLKEREEILRLSIEGLSIREIARRLCRHNSSISRELRRAGMNRKNYSLAVAQVDRNIKARQAGRRSKICKTTKLFKRIRHWLVDLRWSPEQISNKLKKESRGQRDRVSHEAIYQYIYRLKDSNERSIWIQALRQRRKKRRSKHNIRANKTKIPNRTSIHDRPEIVEKREEIGHWEGDLVVGKDHGSAIGTLVERVSRFTIIVELPNGKTSDVVTKAFAKALEPIPAHMKKSLTYDNGSEMASHAILSELTGMTVYFADPGCPGQRGTNENTNGLIRDFYPKATNFNEVSNDALKHTEKLLNQRPRKILKYETPEEVFWSHLGIPEPPHKHRVQSGEESSGDLVL